MILVLLCGLGCIACTALTLYALGMNTEWRTREYDVFVLHTDGKPATNEKRSVRYEFRPDLGAKVDQSRRYRLFAIGFIGQFTFACGGMIVHSLSRLL